MRLSNPRQVLDLDEFLPSDGETGIEMTYVGDVLVLSISYELDAPAPRTARRKISFSRVQSFFKTPFPGYSFFTCPEDRDLSLLHSVVEYGQSDLIDAQSDVAGGGRYRHYRLFLESTGAAIHVIAQSCKMSDDDLIA